MKIGIRNTKHKTLAVTILAMTAALGASMAMAGETRRATTLADLGVWKTSMMFGKPGVANSNGRIVGGTLAQGNRSFAVHTQSEDAWCGGTIIGDSWVLTAAHCGRPNIVKAGSTNHTLGTSYDVIAYYAHPNYIDNQDDDPYDIALIKISGTFPTNLIRAKLADATVMQAVAKPGDPVTVVGWGATREGGGPINDLREVTIPVVSDATCAAVYNGSNGFDITQAVEICAGLPEGGKDSCQGDSGGPLIAPYNGSIYSVGVVSWGDGCARRNRYGVYAETAAFLPWINSYIGGGSSTGTVVHNVNLPSVSTGRWSSTYAVSIPAGTTKLVVNTSGGTGDADLYVRRGSAPSTSTYDFVSAGDANNETVTINNPVAGSTYFIRVYAFSSFSGVNMKATRTP